jgi:hypothetical protein
MDGPRYIGMQNIWQLISQAIIYSSKGGYEIGFFLFREIRNWRKGIYNFAKFREMISSKCREIILQFRRIISFKKEISPNYKMNLLTKFQISLYNYFQEICHIK